MCTAGRCVPTATPPIPATPRAAGSAGMVSAAGALLNLAAGVGATIFLTGGPSMSASPISPSPNPSLAPSSCGNIRLPIEGVKAVGERGSGDPSGMWVLTADRTGSTSATFCSSISSCVLPDRDGSRLQWVPARPTGGKRIEPGSRGAPGMAGRVRCRLPHDDGDGISRLLSASLDKSAAEQGKWWWRLWACRFRREREPASSLSNDSKPITMGANGVAATALLQTMAAQQRTRRPASITRTDQPLRRR
mmetsp:Transcript_48037/g.120269  ORF Transcript_48037/g.120269 Transcript_48037/m.120269 type:complete len:249 (-) Transcript_48037:264-1010(-)